MIRVLRIINRFNLGGPVYNASYLSAGLGEGFETLLIGGKHEENEGDARYIPEGLGLKPVIVEGMQREVSFANDRKALREIRAIIREFNPHIVHTHASKAGALGRRAALKENVPVIVHTFHGHVFHGYFGEAKTSLYKTIERKLAKKTSKIIAISNEQKKQLSEIHQIAPAEKFEVIPLGFDLARFHENSISGRSAMLERFNLPKDKIIIGIIGRLVPIKNHQLLFEALQTIKDKVAEDIVLCIVGDGEKRTELEHASETFMNTSVKVKFLGWQKDIENILPGLDIVALTSLNEGTPVSLIEAQASGTPVISTNVGGVVDVIDDGKTGFVVDSFNPIDFGEKLLELINSKEKREKMTQNGWSFVKDKFSKERLCSDVKELYIKLLEEKGIKK